MKPRYIPFEDYAFLTSDSNAQDTGFSRSGNWGQAGAGILLYYPVDDEVLLLKRSKGVVSSEVYGVSGGARKSIDGKLEPALVTAVTETREELGSLPKGELRRKFYLYEDAGFKYSTYVLELDEQERHNFKPNLDIEHTDCAWFSRTTIDVPLHKGLKEMIENYRF